MPPKKESGQNIQVVVRCRPLNSYERSKGSLTAAECTSDHVTVRERNAPSTASKTFTFDKVFGPLSKQMEVYRAIVKPTVEEVLEGYNCTVFAYGQTGTGKTFTMIGERTDELKYSWEDDPLAGIIPRSLSHLFDRLENSNCEFSVRVSFMELYNEELFDLLSSSEDAPRLRLFDDANRKGSVMVQGLEEVVVTNKDAVYSIIERGMLKRATASTLLNAQSSRSHSVFTVTVHMRENSVDGEELVKIGKLNLVDLAGSENIGRSGAMDKRAREAGNINQSLLTLGRVITALVERTPHVPYRESKLTRILQDSLGGRTKTSIIATISPASMNLEETMSTLDYAHRAKNIQNRPEVNQKLSKKALLREYSDEVERLRRDLQAARDKNGVYLDAGNYNQLQTMLQQQRERIKEQEDLVAMLRSDLVKMTDVLSLTQEEMERLRDIKELLEVDLGASRRQAARIRERLIATEVQRREERYVKEAHQSTEERLTGEAASLLRSADASTADVSALHDKVERMRGTEASNLSRVERFSAELRDTVSDVCGHLQQLSDDTSSRSKKVDGDADDISENVSQWCSNSRARLHELCHNFQCEMSAFGELWAEKASQSQESMAALGSRSGEVSRKKTEHVEDAKAALLSVFDYKLSTAIHDHSGQLTRTDRQLLSDAADTQHTLSQIQRQQSIHEAAFSDAIATVIQAQERRYEALFTKVETDFHQEEQFFATLQAKLQEYKTQRETTKFTMLNDIQTAKAAAQSQMRQLCSRGRAAFMATETEIEAVRGDVKKSAAELQEQLAEAQIVCRCIEEKELPAAKSELVGQIESLDEALEQDLSELKTAVEAEQAAMSCSFALLKSVHDDLEPPVRAATSALEESTTAFEEKAVTDLGGLSEAVGVLRGATESGLHSAENKVDRLASAVTSFLREDVRPTLATGQTPGRRVFEYPRQLARTSPKARLLERFRAQLNRVEVEAACDLDDVIDSEDKPESLRQRRPSSGIGSTCTQSSSRANSPSENLDPSLQPSQVIKSEKAPTVVDGRKKPLKAKN